MTAETKLPEWPTEASVSASASPRYDYQRARADAAMDRLRVAVEALHIAKDMCDHEGWCSIFDPIESHECDCTNGRVLDAACEALAAIGPLPPLPTLPEMGKERE